MKNTHKSGLGAGLLTAAGLGAAFSVASCCALPIFLASFGIGAAWMTGIAMIAVPYRDAILIVSLLALITGAFFLCRQQRGAMSCKPGAVCVPAPLRFMNFLGLIVGAVLLWAGYAYV